MTDNAGTCNRLPAFGQDQYVFARDLADLDGPESVSCRKVAGRDATRAVCHAPAMVRTEAPVVPGWRITVARGPVARARGLLGRRGLPGRCGLWLRTRSVHTVGMRFALDLVWIDRDGAVVRVDRNVGPGRIRSCVAACGVVELRAGEGGALAAALAARNASPA